MDAFSPKAGDVVLFRRDYSHVGMVDSYDPKTGELKIMEGNSGNRVKATTYGTGDEQITFIGRFNNSDFGRKIDDELLNQATPNIRHTDKINGRTR